MSDNNIVRINMSYASEADEASNLPPAAEMSLIYRRVPYQHLLDMEEAFVADPMDALISGRRDKINQLSQKVSPDPRLPSRRD